MRLTKIQRILKIKGIDYDYEEEQGCGTVTFTHDGKFYSFAEYTGNRGKIPVGITTVPKNIGNNQKSAVDYIIQNI